MFLAILTADTGRKETNREFYATPVLKFGIQTAWLVIAYTDQIQLIVGQLIFVEDI